MKVKVSIHGTLRERFPGYRQSHGIEVDITLGATVKDLLVQLGIDATKGVAVIKQGRIQKVTDTIQPGATLSVLQAMNGG